MADRSSPGQLRQALHAGRQQGGTAHRRGKGMVWGVECFSDAQQLETRDFDVERSAVLVNHAITPAHRSLGRVEWAAGNVVEARARGDQGHLADDPLTDDLVYGAVPVNDGPA